MTAQAARGTEDAGRGTRTKVVAVTLVAAVAAMVVGPILWPTSDPPLFPEPTATQLPQFVVLQVVTCLTFGLGVSFLLFGLPVVREVTAGWKRRAWSAYLSIGWLLVSWWCPGGLMAICTSTTGTTCRGSCTSSTASTWPRCSPPSWWPTASCR
jgi:hypothetical protein